MWSPVATLENAADEDDDLNPSLCVSSPPAWAQPFTVCEKDFMHQARACFPVSVQPDKFKMLATQPLERQVFMENFRTAHLNFWKQCHPVYPDLPEVPAVIKKIPCCNWVTTNPRIQKKRVGGSKCALQLQSFSVCASTKSTRRTSRLQKDDAHCRVRLRIRSF